MRAVVRTTRVQTSGWVVSQRCSPDWPVVKGQEQALTSIVTDLNLALR
jgi:hypothetical protein